MASEKTKIYHERQKLQFCLIHSLNNLFQQKDVFTKASLNSISEKLVLDDPNKEKWTPLSALFRPHHNAITGNYDINVLISALEEKGKRVVWHDRRNGASTIDLDGPDDTFMGIVLNIPVRQFGGLWRSRHWVTMKRIEGVWYNLDSDLRAPQSFKDNEEVREFLDCIVDLGGEVLLVMNDKDDRRLWPHLVLADTVVIFGGQGDNCALILNAHFSASFFVGKLRGKTEYAHQYPIHKESSPCRKLRDSRKMFS